MDSYHCLTLHPRISKEAAPLHNKHTKALEAAALSSSQSNWLEYREWMYYYFSFRNSKLSLFVYSSEFGKLLLLVALVLKVCLLLIHTVISLHNITPLHPSKWQTFSHSYTSYDVILSTSSGLRGLSRKAETEW